jgi:hypothetical protein
VNVSLLSFLIFFRHFILLEEVKFVIRAKPFALVFAVSHSVADARYLGDPMFATQRTELHTFALKFSPTVEQTVENSCSNSVKPVGLGAAGEMRADEAQTGGFQACVFILTRTRNSTRRSNGA